MSENDQQEKEKTSKTKQLLKKFGIAGFLFFFIKGLIWLAILFGLGKYLGF